MILSGNILILRWALERYGDAGFDELLMMRRLTSALMPVLSVSMVVSLAKLVPQSATNPSPRDRASLLASSFQLAAIACVVYFLSTLTMPNSLSQFVTGRPDLGPQLSALAIYAAGLICSVCTGAYCRGMLSNNRANTLQIVSLVLVPLVVLALSSNVQSFLWGTGTSLVLLNLLHFAWIEWPQVHALWHWNHRGVVKLLKNGAPRLLGDTSYYGLLAFPAIAAAQVGGITFGAEFAYGLVAISLLMQVAAPMNQFFLAETAYLCESGERQRLVRRLTRGVGFALACTLLAIGLLEWWAPSLVALHLGRPSPGYATAVRWIAPAALSLNLVLCLRGVVDAIATRAVIPHASVLAFGVFLVTHLGLRMMNYTTASVVVPLHLSVALLALVTTTAAVLYVRQVGADRVSFGQASTTSQPSTKAA